MFTYVHLNVCSLQHHVEFYTKRIEEKKRNDRKIPRKYYVSIDKISSKNNYHSVDK